MMKQATKERQKLESRKDRDYGRSSPIQQVVGRAKRETIVEAHRPPISRSPSRAVEAVERSGAHRPGR